MYRSIFQVDAAYMCGIRKVFLGPHKNSIKSNLCSALPLSFLDVITIKITMTIIVERRIVVCSSVALDFLSFCYFSCCSNEAKRRVYSIRFDYDSKLCWLTNKSREKGWWLRKKKISNHCSNRIYQTQALRMHQESMSVEMNFPLGECVAKENGVLQETWAHISMNDS